MPFHIHLQESYIFLVNDQCFVVAAQIFQSIKQYIYIKKIKLFFSKYQSLELLCGIKIKVYGPKFVILIHEELPYVM